MSNKFEYDIVSKEVYNRAIERFKQAGIKLPTFSLLANPPAFREEIEARIEESNPDSPDARNLFQAH